MTIPDRVNADTAFRVEDGALIRSVVPRRGRGGTYEHVCTLAVFESVCHAIDELRGQPTSLDDLIARTGLPHTQISTALAFLKERGCVVSSRSRRHVAATGCVHLDAMTEFHVLADQRLTITNESARARIADLEAMLTALITILKSKGGVE